MNVVRALRPYVSAVGGPTGGGLRKKSEMGGRCEICAAAIPGDHSHVLETSTRAVLCSCSQCARLFAEASASLGRLRALPDRVLVSAAARVDNPRWASIGVPVGLAFVVRESSSGAVRCVYPSPGGPVESELSGPQWAALATVFPVASAAEPDVEGIWLRRARDGECECFVAPIDRCYALVGAVRAAWRGFDGGDEVRRAVEDYFSELRAQGRSPPDGGKACP